MSSKITAMEPAKDRLRLEWIAVAVVTAIGLVVRSWSLSTLGLTHFDEGIYALAGSWSLDPRGLAAIDPTLIPYAPPGFPILVGCSYAIFGRSDTAAILVSIVAGTSTIPVVAWLGRRTFGPGAGFASAVLATISGAHIAFSRVAMTDVSFLLAWLIAMGMGQRFLERPTAWRAIVMGLAVGLAQQFKYNGWLMGGIVILTAILGVFLELVPARTGFRERLPSFRIFGWGLVSALVAWLMVWPWYGFVEAHGGYSALLRHQRSYLGGFRDWWPHYLTQSMQSLRLGENDSMLTPAMYLAIPSARLAWPPAWSVFPSERGDVYRLGLLACALIVAIVFPTSSDLLGLLVIPSMLTSVTPAVRLLGVSGLVMMVMVPFYHPYARLMLPIQAFGWLLMGGLLSGFAAKMLQAQPWGEPTTRKGRAWVVVAGSLILGALVLPSLLGSMGGHACSNPATSQTDSLRKATDRIALALPKDVVGLRLLVRPPVTFYLAGRVALYPQSGLDQLSQPGDPRIWAIVDTAILQSELGGDRIVRAVDLPAKIRDHWEVVRSYRNSMAMPTLLDFDPTLVSSTAPLWLLRPRRPGALR